MDAARRLIDENTILLSVTAASNLTGRLTDVRALCDMAHEAGAAAAVDASQYVPHIAPDVNVFDCDYLVFSAHKVYGPEGSVCFIAVKACLILSLRSATAAAWQRSTAEI